MCIAVFIWKAHPLYPFLVFLNRDEYHDRPTKPLSWWEDGDILGGRDEVAGGTWMACTRSGRVAFLTNVREINSNSDTKSRGELPVRFLKSVKSPHDFSEQLLKEAGEYNGFNLIVADLCSMTMLYITNRPKDSGMSVTEVSPSIHVLSNATLDTPWPKNLMNTKSGMKTLTQKDCCGVDEKLKMARERLHEIQQQTADGKYHELMEEGSS